MRTRIALGILVLALSVAACSRPQGMTPHDVVYAPAADAAAAPADMATADVSTAPRVAAGPPMLAYSYAYGLSVPAKQVDGLRRRHEEACVKAGYTVCQVVSTSVREEGSERIDGELVIRAAPQWLRSFRDGIGSDAKGVGGKVVESDVRSEDLSREIVDTSAQLQAKTVLRDRLKGLLADRPARLADLLAVERELARVQGEIDSTRSQLAVMQARVSMSSVTITYESMGMVATTGPWTPLARAVNDFLAIIAESLAALVRLMAWLAPWILIGGGLVWVFRKRLPKLRWPRRRTSNPPET